MNRILAKATLIVGSAFIAMLMTSCSIGGGIIGRTLRAAGAVEPPVPVVETPKAPVVIKLHLQAGMELNAGSDGNPTAAVIKIYQLRDSQRFERMPFAEFLDSSGESGVLEQDTLSVNEVVLTPGTDVVLDQRMLDGATRLGVVALMREPAGGQWRLVMDVTDPGTMDSKISIWAGACRLSTDSEMLLFPPAPIRAVLLAQPCSPGW